MQPHSPLSRLQGVLRQQKLDALLVSQPENRRYLSGYRATDHGIQESAGFLLIPRGDTPILLTDARFVLQAHEEAPACEVVIHRRGLLKELGRLIKRMRLSRLGFESDYFLHASFVRLSKLAQAHQIELVPLLGMIEKIRAIKNEAELALIRQSTRLNEQVFQQVYATIEAGQSEVEIALRIEQAMRTLGAEGPSFSTIVAFGENAAKPHAIPTARRLQPGEPILIDMGLILNGYCSDMSRTFMLGEADALFVKRLRLVRKAQLAAIAAIREGVSGAAVDQVARKIFSDAGHGQAFGHGLGHGVGLAVHEAPRLSPRGLQQLRAGMVVTVEPGLYFPEWGGIRLENMVIVEKNGCEVLNKDLTFLDF